MLFRTVELSARTYPSFDRCIFCGCSERLTDEHVVPEALSGIGEIKIARGSCLRCNNGANERYEQPALKNDFLPIRYMLALKRKRRGKKTKPALIGGFASDPSAIDTDRPDSSLYDLAIDPKDAPQICHFAVHPPAGLLVGEDRSVGATSLRLHALLLGKPMRPGANENFAFQVPMVLGAPEMVVAKMAYCFAVAERGLDFHRYVQLRDLLMDKRKDVFNFVGEPLVKEKLANRHLHGFYFRERDNFRTAIVHLFASFGGPAYEVVLEPR